MNYPIATTTVSELSVVDHTWLWNMIQSAQFGQAYIEFRENGCVQTISTASLHLCYVHIISDEAVRLIERLAESKKTVVYSWKPEVFEVLIKQNVMCINVAALFH